MIAEILDAETAYTEGYLEATEEILEDMRRKQIREWQRRQERDARHRYFMEQKFYGLISLAVGLFSIWELEDATFAVVMIPLGLVLLLSKKMLITNDYYFHQKEKEEEETEWS